MSTDTVRGETGRGSAARFDFPSGLVNAVFTINISPLRAKETDLVAVIEGREEAGGACYIEFRVYQSPGEPDRILASWRFPISGTAIEESKPGNSVETEFRFAVECADQHAIPFVWVNDPDELFPPWARPK